MKSIIFILAITYCSSLLSQQVVTTAGSTLENSSGGISYTIGEGISETLSSGDITLTQGFQQTNIFVSLYPVQYFNQYYYFHLKRKYNRNHSLFRNA